MDKRAAKPSGRIVLSRREIRALDTALTAAFQSMHELRDRYEVAKYIKLPPLPPVFSESIIITAAPRIFGTGWKAEYGGKRCDLLLRHKHRGSLTAEVKATGEHAFQEFKRKDIEADRIVWIHFGRRFQVGRGKIVVWVLRNPRRYIHAPCRLDIERFRRRTGTTADLRNMEFESLDDLLAGPPATRKATPGQ